MTVCIAVPLYNQLDYTKLCLESLEKYGCAGAEILLIDNGSSDGTAEFLSSYSGVTVISNSDNLGCAGAWNQAIRATDSEWLVILNNDVIVSTGWLEGLLSGAEKYSLDVVSPAIREGEYNYDISNYSAEFTSSMAAAQRVGVADGICFMVRRRVFDTIGLFDEKFRIGQFEDADFFRRASIAGFRLGITGRSFIHHFGSVTQGSISKSKTVRPYVEENRQYFRQKWNLGCWQRFRERRLRKWREFFWRTNERLRYGHSLKEKWLDGRLCYY